MKKIILLSIFSLFLQADNCQCKNRLTLIFENEYEKIFEINETIYKIVKGEYTTLFVLDNDLKQYIKIKSDEPKKDDNVLELMK
jgi:hypothetical protein